jgi:hypothetical protein
MGPLRNSAIFQPYSNIKLSSANMCSHLIKFLPVCAVHIFKDNTTTQLIFIVTVADFADLYNSSLIDG